jgi:hypothetical protein
MLTQTNETSAHVVNSFLETLTAPEGSQPQWDVLSDFIEGKKYNILPIIDTSPSMNFELNSEPKTTAINVATMLGLYFAAKNNGIFNKMMCSFSSHPKLCKISSENVEQQIEEIGNLDWDTELDIGNLLIELLKFAIENSVPAAEMPNAILIMTDVNFYSVAIRVGLLFKDSEVMIHHDYKKAGYEIPHFIFWNLNNPAAVVTQKGENNVAEISGFNPSILKAILALNNGV